MQWGLSLAGGRVSRGLGVWLGDAGESSVGGWGSSVCLEVTGLAVRTRQESRGSRPAPVGCTGSQNVSLIRALKRTPPGGASAEVNSVLGDLRPSKSGGSHTSSCHILPAPHLPEPALGSGWPGPSSRFSSWVSPHWTGWASRPWWQTRLPRLRHSHKVSDRVQPPAPGQLVRCHLGEQAGLSAGTQGRQARGTRPAPGQCCS